MYRLYEHGHAANLTHGQASIDAAGLYVDKRQRPKKFAPLGAVDLIGANVIRKLSSSESSFRSEQVLSIPSPSLRVTSDFKGLLQLIKRHCAKMKTRYALHVDAYVQ